MTIKDFIHDLQISSDERKKRWLIALSCIATLAVIGVWVINLNLSIAGVAQLDNPYASNKPSIVNVFMAGVFIIADKTMTGLLNSYAYFNKKTSDNNTITIHKDELNFMYDNTQSIDARPFP